MRQLLILILCALLWQGSSSAQSLAVRDALSGDTRLTAVVGDTLTFEIIARLGDLPASGVALYLAVPARGLDWVTTGDGPFEAGELFAGGIEFSNAALEADESWGLTGDVALLSYAILMGPGSSLGRSISGSGVIASVRAVCTEPMKSGYIGIFDNPIHQTRVVLADGRSELPAMASHGVEMSSAPSPADPPLAASAATVEAGQSWGRLKLLSRRH